MQCLFCLPQAPSRVKAFETPSQKQNQCGNLRPEVKNPSQAQNNGENLRPEAENTSPAQNNGKNLRPEIGTMSQAQEIAEYLRSEQLARPERVLHRSVSGINTFDSHEGTT